MSATNAPFGLRPAYHPSGLDRATALFDGILSGFASDILKGQPVKMATTGVIQPAAAGEAFLGAFSGVEFTDTTGRRRVSNFFPANTAYQAGSCIAYYYDDPNIVYEIQGDGPMTQAMIGAESDLSATTAGSAVIGLSECTISTGVVAAGQPAQMRIINLAPYPGNAFGDAFTIVRATIAEHQYVAVANAI